MSLRNFAALFLLLCGAFGCSEQEDLTNPPPDDRTLWTVRARGGGDFTDLQAGVNAAGDGDTVLVGPGVYASPGHGPVDGNDQIFGLIVGGIDPRSWKSIVIRSEKGPDSTVIGDVFEASAQVVFYNTPGGVLEGFHVRGVEDKGDLAAKAVLAVGSTIELRGNRFSKAVWGVYASRSELDLVSNHLTENLTAGLSADATVLTSRGNLYESNRGNGLSCGNVGGATLATFAGDTVRTNGASGISLSSMTATATEMLIDGNDGAGIDLTDSELTLTSSTIVNNGFGQQRRDAIFLTGSGSRLVAQRTIFAFSAGCAVEIREGTADVSCCAFWGNQGIDGSPQCVAVGSNGNFGLNPVFCNTTTGDWGLRDDSPCAPDNSGGCGLIGAYPVNCQ